MLDHMTFRVTDIAQAKTFHSAALAPLGYSVCFEGNYGSNMVGLAYPDATEPDGKKADVWFIDGPSPYGGPAATSGCHLAWRASSRAQVDAFYKAALAAGGSLAPTLGWLVGVGPGAGMALILIITGLAAALVGVGGYLFPAIRNAEDLLPDHDALPDAA